MTKFQRDIFALINSALSSVPAEIGPDFDWNMAKTYGCEHKVLPLLFHGAYHSKIDLPEEQKKFFSIAAAKFLMRSEYQSFALEQLREKFDAYAIDYLPLKGTELKQYYPAPQLRPMGDLDILIRMEQYDTLRSIMLELGYQEDKESDHEWVWINDKVMIELHKRLIPSYNVDYYPFFGDGWDMAQPVEPGSNLYAFSKEDNFVYLFTHFAKHYRDAGIGLLPLIDLYLYRRHNTLDEAVIRSSLQELKLLEFYDNILLTIDVCFCGKQSTPVTDRIIDRTFDSGSFGTAKAQAVSTAVKKTKDIRHSDNVRSTLFFKRVFMSYPEMCRRHPILKKAPILLPAFWGYRIFSVALFKHENVKHEIDKLKVSDSDSVQAYHDDLKFVGLDFNFSE